MNKDYEILNTFISFIGIAVGALLASIALDIFLIPNSIIDGGITGISMILNKIFGGNLSLYVLIINIPFFILGYKQLGKEFLFKGVFAMIMYTLLLNFFKEYNPITKDIILSFVFGGLLLGIGSGLVIKFGGCLDGTEVLSIMLSKKTGLSVGKIILIFNIFIYGTAIFIYGPDRALYSMLTYFISFKAIDMVSSGLDSAKQVFIITDNPTQIIDSIYNDLGRTVTLLKGFGVVSSSKKVILYTVITRLELSKLRNIVKNADSSSFVTVSDVSEVIGDHIKKKPVYESNT